MEFISISFSIPEGKSTNCFCFKKSRYSINPFLRYQSQNPETFLLLKYERRFFLISHDHRFIATPFNFVHYCFKKWGAEPQFQILFCCLFAQKYGKNLNG